MIIEFEQLQKMPQETLDMIIKEFIISQIEDSNIEYFNEETLKQAKIKVEKMLKEKKIIATYRNKTIQLRHSEQF